MTNQQDFHLSDLGLPESNYIYFHKYKIFRDLSRKDFITGDELQTICESSELSTKKKDNQSKRWLFFYRGQPRLLPHVNLKKREVYNLTKRQHQMETEGITIPLAIFLLIFGVGFTLTQLGLFILLGIWSVSSFATPFLYFSRMEHHAKAITTHKTTISIIEEQYKNLCKQIKNRYSRKEIDFHWGRDQKAIEADVKGKFANHLTTQEKGEPFFISSWGVQQPPQVLTQHIDQGTGLSQTINDMGKNCLTWRHGEGVPLPMYRVIYCQILIITSVGIISGRFFQDIIRMERKYGERYEFIAKSHISNIQSVHVEASQDQALKELADEKFHPVIFVNKSRSVSLSASSGNIVNCITPDAKLLQKALNEWLTYLSTHKHYNDTLNNPQSNDMDELTAIESLEAAIKEKEELVDEMMQHIYRTLTRTSQLRTTRRNFN